MVWEAGIQEDCLKSCIWIFFHLPFIVIRIIETALFAAENPELVISVCACLQLFPELSLGCVPIHCLSWILNAR